MIVNTSFGFIFVHVPKAAGTSVTNLLGQYTNYCDLEIGGTDFGEKIQNAYRQRFGLSKHSSARDIRNTVGHVQWSKLYSFSFVRNPFTRTLSTFQFLRNWEGLPQDFKSVVMAFRGFEDYLMSDWWANAPGPDDIFRPQLHWLRTTPSSTELLVDYVGKTETIAKDLAHVAQAIGLPKQESLLTAIPRLNESRNTAPVAWSMPMVSRIAERYRQDFEAFSYPVAPPRD